MAESKKFMYGIGAVKFGEKQLGYIEKGSWDWGGSKPEKVDVEAEQVVGAPVLTLVTTNGTIAPTFNLIQLDYENLQLALGGTLVGSSGAYTGWKAPTDLVELRGKCEIVLKSGQTVTIPKIECQLTVNAPSDNSAPYEVSDTKPGGSGGKL